MNDVLYITGHRNPDTDSICSAIAYADFKNKTSSIPAIPIRLGSINRETEFILNYFGVEAPKLLPNVKTQILDLDIDKVPSLSPNISIKMAWSIMKKNNIKTLPVSDEDNKLLGLASLSNITSSYMDIWDNNVLSKSGTKLEHIIDTLSGKCIYYSEESEKNFAKIVVAAMQPEGIKEIIEEGDIVICGNRKDAQEMILNSKASLMIVTGNYQISEDILEQAKNTGCSIVQTPYDTFTAARLLPQSIPVSYIMAKDDLIKFKPTDFVDDIKDIMLETRYRTYPVVDEEDKVVGSISRYHLISQNKKKVILVDHNEKTQSVLGLDDAEILEIIDHHRLGDIQTGTPIYFRNEPVGSTATIVASIFFENGVRPSRKIAGILAGGIISDTLLFKSPTSTVMDKLMLKRLSQIANINPEEFAMEMFKAGSSLKGKSVDEVFYGDFKEFFINNTKIAVTQVSTIDDESFNPIEKDIMNLMEKKAKEEKYSLIVLMLTNIFKGGSKLIVAGKHKEFVSQAFNVQLDENSAYVPGVVSRKKQVIPPLTNVISSAVIDEEEEEESQE
ncbi:cobalt-dependent inorganic pyrophosphatase [Clostridium acetireducens DSM 10703]|jgi:manganese-dependent inorganic pyrophosphatase|uniref:inorganic diphosphatase n=1 Tax=Clostridium acetireducens DSM 10703 TaxID=1121290 RepID=A0A1E8EVA7_9CLOT|nr:putative manganese-dependent inorganic diphosphatase [Clostridium acetireducens]OFH98064.1 cobalt-dependent inorganic pyrophosphatase [Clostridium acetireducens DSM 10703]